MQVHGIDMERAAYRVSFVVNGRRIDGMVPEALIADQLCRSGRPAHGDAYEFIAAHRPQIEKALTAMARGGPRIRAPWGQLTLERDPHDAD